MMPEVTLRRRRPVAIILSVLAAWLFLAVIAGKAGVLEGAPASASGAAHALLVALSLLALWRIRASMTTLLRLGLVGAVVVWLGGCCSGFGVNCVPQEDAQPGSTPWEARIGFVDALETTPQDTLIALERTICFGFCPVYEVVVYGDGRVIYNGLQFVGRQGVVQDRISRARLNELIAAFTAADYTAFPDTLAGPDACPMMATDLPTVTTALRLEDRVKRVVHDHGCGGFEGKEKLTALEDAVDRIIGTQQWVARDS